MGPLDHDTDRLQLLDTRLTFPIIVIASPLPVARAAQEAERLRLGAAQVVGANDEPESGSEAHQARCANARLVYRPGIEAFRSPGSATLHCQKRPA